MVGEALLWQRQGSEHRLCTFPLGVRGFFPQGAGAELENREKEGDHTEVQKHFLWTWSVSVWAGGGLVAAQAEAWASDHCWANPQQDQVWPPAICETVLRAAGVWACTGLTVNLFEHTRAGGSLPWAHFTTVKECIQRSSLTPHFCKTSQWS